MKMRFLVKNITVFSIRENADVKIVGINIKIVPTVFEPVESAYSMLYDMRILQVMVSPCCMNNRMDNFFNNGSTLYEIGG